MEIGFAFVRRALPHHRETEGIIGPAQRRTRAKQPVFRAPPQGRCGILHHPHL